MTPLGALNADTPKAVMSSVRRTSRRFRPSSVAPGASRAAGSSSSSFAKAYLVSTAVVIQSSYVDILDIELLEAEDYPQIVRCQDKAAARLARRFLDECGDSGLVG